MLTGSKKGAAATKETTDGPAAANWSSPLWYGGGSSP